MVVLVTLILSIYKVVIEVLGWNLLLRSLDINITTTWGMIFKMNRSANLRATFDEDAERYNRFRPQYPDELLSTLIAETKTTPVSTLLEIGPGTGQATKPFAKLGADITGIELGVELANKARTELRQYPNVHIITSSFEDVDLPDSNYDLIFSATALHWVKDEYKFTKTAALLKPGGYLVIIHTEHVSDGNGDAFFRASQPIYDKYWPPNGTAPFSLPSINQLQAPYIDKQLFELKNFTVFPKTLTYSATEYAGLLSTYSPVIALPPDERQTFLANIEFLITEQFGNKLEKHFAFTLAIAQKK